MAVFVTETEEEIVIRVDGELGESARCGHSRRAARATPRSGKTGSKIRKHWNRAKSRAQKSRGVLERRRLTEADQFALVTAYRGGAELGAIVTRFRVSQPTVYRVLRKYGVPRHTPPLT
jgi:hypothetical protein